MDLKSSIKNWVGSGIRAVDRSQETRIPDACLGPAHPPVGFPSGRPSLVLEVGNTQSQPSLEENAVWWLDAKKGGAAICLTCKLFKNKKIDIDVWERQVPEGQPANRAIITKAQHIIASHDKNRQEVSVRGGPLRIKFSLFMRRVPDPVKEYDLILEEEQPKDFASGIWEERGM